MAASSTSMAASAAVCARSGRVLACWVLDRRRYRYCFRTARCRRACAEDRFADGRCKHGFPYLLPLCECLRPRCAAAAGGGGATSLAALRSIPE
ncbi:hypothetical protein PVAP13_3KG483967 [Panicum virgatum]|uniref:Uncharacterized protein n=1 Tax=Panicum virgatum TaxID=38727 RepID=A0A8T0V067_PANVG|nr:hypothetical protein PVAP13_3KG483967 [Panicum virgatum]